MNTSIVLTVIAKDQPGVIQAVSAVITKKGGNWTKSSMSSLAGQFAGILLVSVPSENVDNCLRHLQELESEGLHVIAHVSDQVEPAEEAREYVLNLVGNDRLGIVHEVMKLMKKHNINVNSFETVVEGASMGGGDLFRAKALLVIPQSADIDVLEKELEAIANDLMVDIRFEK